MCIWLSLLALLLDFEIRVIHHYHGNLCQFTKNVSPAVRRDVFTLFRGKKNLPDYQRGIQWLFLTFLTKDKMGFPLLIVQIIANTPMCVNKQKFKQSVTFICPFSKPNQAPDSPAAPAVSFDL
jgi:hypothetical protein